MLSKTILALVKSVTKFATIRITVIKPKYNTRTHTAGAEKVTFSLGGNNDTKQVGGT